VNSHGEEAVRPPPASQPMAMPMATPMPDARCPMPIRERLHPARGSRPRRRAFIKKTAGAIEFLGCGAVSPSHAMPPGSWRGPDGHRPRVVGTRLAPLHTCAVWCYPGDPSSNDVRGRFPATNGGAETAVLWWPGGGLAAWGTLEARVRLRPHNLARFTAVPSGWLSSPTLSSLPACAPDRSGEGR
jgi:hypothetical protein